MKRILAALVALGCIAGCGDGDKKESPYALKTDLAQYAKKADVNARFDGVFSKLKEHRTDINERQKEIKDIQEGLGRDKDGHFIVLRDLHDVKVILGVGTKDAVTSEDVRAMKKYLSAQNDRVIRERSGQLSETVALAVGPDIPAPGVPPRPEPTVQQQPVVDPRYRVTTRTGDCIAICDQNTGRSYQWVREQSGWRLLLWQQNHCARCGRVHNMWAPVQTPPGFPTP